MQLSIVQIALFSRLLEESLPLDAAARRVWLETLAPEYQDLAPALRKALLPEDFQGTDSNALSTLPKLGPAGEAGDSLAGKLQMKARIGPYELIRLLGTGGMAQVWLARRADGAFKRDVALKLPMLTRQRVDLEQRFARERDILASLEHPQIARFYDAGVDPDGLPYFAMEYVQGQWLTDWCDSNRLGVSARLELLLEVLKAVQYAHEKHVIHRDLKPSNILVTESGEVRLLDFGVAKLLETENADQTQLTGVYGRALTPDYTSPELLRGDALDPRSDVYSLGVVLYELLTGVRPYQLTNAASMGLLQQAVSTVEVRRPSALIDRDAAAVRAATHEQLARQLRGDLDSIALRALAKEPEDRYSSVAALAEDLQLYLAGRPIKAQPARFIYRSCKFVLRNRTVIAVTAAAAASILIILGYAIHREAVYQANTKALAIASVAAKPASAVVVSAPSPHSIAVLPFVDMSASKDQEYFADGLSEELIDHLANSPDLKVIARTSSFQFKGKNEDVRSIAEKLGVANLLEGSVRKLGGQMRITAQLIKASDGTHLWSQTYDRSVNDIFQVQDEIAARVTQALDAALSVNAAAAAERPQNVEAYNLLLKGNFFFERNKNGDLDRAQREYQQALVRDPGYAQAWTSLAGVYFFQGYDHELSPKKAESKILEALRRALAINPNSAAAHRWLGRTYKAYDWDWENAQRELERAVSLEPTGVEGWVSRKHLAYLRAQMTGQVGDIVQLAQEDLARNPLDTTSLEFLAGMQFFAGQFTDSTDTLNRALKLEPANIDLQAQSAWNLLVTGNATAAVAAAEKFADEDSKIWILAMAYWSLGKKSDADLALDKLRRKVGASDPTAIADIYAFRGELDTAISWLERGYRQRDPTMDVIKLRLTYAPLRGEPGYKALLAKMKLPE
jgi:serine/threonine protein kinase/Tfp pilus assembly protein PilF